MSARLRPPLAHARRRGRSAAGRLRSQRRERALRRRSRRSVRGRWGHPLARAVDRWYAHRASRSRVLVEAARVDRRQGNRQERDRSERSPPRSDHHAARPAWPRRRSRAERERRERAHARGRLSLRRLRGRAHFRRHDGRDAHRAPRDEYEFCGRKLSRRRRQSVHRHRRRQRIAHRVHDRAEHRGPEGSDGHAAGRSADSSA